MRKLYSVQDPGVEWFVCTANQDSINQPPWEAFSMKIRLIKFSIFCVYQMLIMFKIWVISREIRLP